MSRASFILIAIITATNPHALFGQELPAAQISAGYSHVASPTAVIPYGSDERGDAPHSGWFAQVVGNMFPHFGVVGELSATYTTSTVSGRAEDATHHVYSFLGGGRVTSRCCRRVAPFGQVLAGMVRMNTDVTRGTRHVTSFPTDYFGLLFGGGADIRMGNGPAGFHLAADIVRINRGNADGFGPSGNTWRMRVGITVPMR